MQSIKESIKCRKPHSPCFFPSDKDLLDVIRTLNENVKEGTVDIEPEQGPDIQPEGPSKDNENHETLSVRN